MQPRRLRLRAVLVIVALALGGAAPQSGLDVELSATVATPARPVLNGVTNLPDGSLLSVTVSRAEAGYVATVPATVLDGRFTAGPFARDAHDLDPGGYTVEVKMVMSAQPREVRRVIGSHGMQMHGPLMQQGSSGQYIDYRTEFTLAGVVTDPAPAVSEPGQESWLADSCRSRLEFLNGAVRARTVSGHEIGGGERDAWMADCVRQARQVPTSAPNPS